MFNLLDTPGHEDFSRGHLPHADGGRRRGDGAGRRQGHRGADPEAVRGLPPARHPDRHLHQQDGPRGAATRSSCSTRSRRSWRSTRRRSTGRSAAAGDSTACSTCATSASCSLDADDGGGRAPLRRHRRSRSSTRWSAEPTTPRRCRGGSSWPQAALKPFDLQAFLEGHMTPVFFGSRAAQFRRRPAARRARRATRRRPARRSRRPAHRRARRGRGHRLRLQGPGQHGPEPPRPHRLPAAVLGQASSAA